MLDKPSKAYWNNTSFRQLLENSKSLFEVSNEEFNLVYLAGCHGTMYDFPEDKFIQSIVKKHFEKGKLIAAICHGVCGLLNVKLTENDFLIKGKKVTGFNWLEETLAKRKKLVPFNLEAELKERGADYKKSLLPMTSHTVRDGNIITAQNPFSSKKASAVIMDALKTIYNK